MVCHLSGEVSSDNRRLRVNIICENFGSNTQFQTNLEITNPPPRDFENQLRQEIARIANQNPNRATEIDQTSSPAEISRLQSQINSLQETQITLVPQRIATPINLNDPNMRNPRIGIIGDSITHIGNSGNGYARIIQRNIPNSIVEAHGIVGNRTGEMRRRFEADITAHNYNIVIIEGGVNDLPAVTSDSLIQRRVELIERNLTRMIQMARENGSQVILLTVMPWAGYGTSSQSAQRATNELNRWILNQNDPQHGIRVVNMSLLGEPDRNGFLRLRAGISMDNLHPINRGTTHNGQTEIARLILDQAFAIEIRQNQQSQQRITR